MKNHTNLHNCDENNGELYEKSYKAPDLGRGSVGDVRKITQRFKIGLMFCNGVVPLEMYEKSHQCPLPYVTAALPLIAPWRNRDFSRKPLAK